jgi:hypothetical protein
MATVDISAHAADVVGTDWGPALEAAYQVIKANGGTINIDTDIRIESETELSDPAHADVPINLVSDGGHTVRIHAPVRGLYPGPTNAFRMNGLNIIGGTGTVPAAPDYFDAVHAVVFGRPDKSVFENGLIAGVAASSTLIYLADTHAVIRDSRIGGTAAAGSGSVYADNVKSLLVENTEFLDYQVHRGLYYDRQPTDACWIKVFDDITDPQPVERVITIRNCMLDEMPKKAIDIEGAPKVRIQEVRVNINRTGGPSVSAGFKLKDVKHAIIENCWIRQYHAEVHDLPAIVLENCTEVVIDGLTVGNGSIRVEIDANTRLFLKNSPTAVVDAPANAWYEVDGVLRRGTRTQL